MGILDSIVKVAAIKATENVALRYIEKKEKTYIRMPVDSDEYIGRHYQAVYKELKALGFRNIALMEIKDLIKGWFTKDGTVEEVIINGKDSFRERAKFDREASVAIRYHTFVRKKQK